MGDGEKTPLKLNFDPKVRLEFRGASITSDAGLLACRELDDALGLTDPAADFLKESRTGNNIRHRLIPLLRQSVYRRLRLRGHERCRAPSPGSRHESSGGLERL